MGLHKRLPGFNFNLFLSVDGCGVHWGVIPVSFVVLRLVLVDLPLTLSVGGGLI